MVRLAAFLSFALGFVFYAWKVSHGIWTPELFALLGLTLWCFSDIHDYRP